MPQPSFLAARRPVARRICGALVACLALSGGVARASETAPHRPATAPALPASAPSTVAGPATADDGRDPLDIVRERLAARLGAVKPPGAASPNVVRVVSKAGATEAPGVGRTAAAGATLHAPKPAGVPAAGMAADAAHAHPMWSYAGEGGPDAWARMNPEYAACATGSRQSPIDIRDGIRVDLDPVQFDYRPSAFRVIDNGHTVQVNVGPGNSIETLGRRYELVQFHFHRPSEERINGRQFDMVVHLVHKDAAGRLAVVAVLLDRGSAQPVVQAVWNNLPLEKGEEVAARQPLDLAALLPTDRSYYTYMGSLTTPPCSEGVLWMVMKNPVPIAPAQVDVFSRLYPMNARPVQSVAGRLIKESN